MSLKFANVVNMQTDTIQTHHANYRYKRIDHDCVKYKDEVDQDLGLRRAATEQEQAPRNNDIDRHK